MNAVARVLHANPMLSTFKSWLSMIGNTIPPTEEPIRGKELRHNTVIGRAAISKGTSEDDSHSQRTVSAPVMRLDREARYVYQSSTEAHPNALREKDLIILVRVRDREHEQTFSNTHHKHRSRSAKDDRNKTHENT